MAAEAPGKTRTRSRTRLLWLVGALVVVGSTYFLLPQSWFEIPTDNPAPNAEPRTPNPALSLPKGAERPATLDELRADAAKSPLDFTARSRYGMALAAAGRKGEALQEFLAAARLAPEAPVVHHNLGVYYLNNGQPAKADAAFCRELEIAPGDGRAHYFRGMTFQARNQHERAVEQFRLAIALAPALPDSYLSLAVQRAEKQPASETKALIDKYIELGGNKTLAYFVLSRAYRARKEYTEAARYAEMTVEQNPNSYNYWHNLGLIYSFMRRFDDAERALLRATELIRNPSTAYIELGMNAQRAGRFDRTVEFFKKALEASPETYNVHLYLARAYERLGDLESARREEKTFRQMERRHQQLKLQRNRPVSDAHPAAPPATTP